MIIKSDNSLKEVELLVCKALKDSFDFDISFFIYHLSHLRAVIANYPFSPKDGYHDYTIFFKDQLKIKKPLEQSGSAEKVKAGERVIYWQVEIGQTLRSKFALALAKSPSYINSTTRNLKTLNKIVRLAETY